MSISLTEAPVVRVVHDTENTLYALLLDLYDPFLAASHLRDSHQYTIHQVRGCESRPVGCLSLGKSDFVQIALVPSVRGTATAQDALHQLVTHLRPLSRVGWTSHRHNYPSLRLLHRLGGGVFERCAVDRRRVNMEGFYRPGGGVPKAMRAALEGILAPAKSAYIIWVGEQYQKRAELQRRVAEYVESAKVELADADPGHD